MSVSFLRGIDNGGNRLTSVADPTSATDAATKQYVDNLSAGFTLKVPVTAASTANVTVASALTNGSTMDGVTLATGNRVLLKNQTTQSENGIYVVVASGAASRSTDANSAAGLQGALVTVNQGTTNGDTMWYQTADSITVGTTSIVWSKYAPGSTYAAGNGISVASNTISAVADTGISVSGTGIAINTSLVTRKYATDIGDGTSTTITVTHNLGTKDVQVQVFPNSGNYDTQWPDIYRPTTNTVQLVFTTAPASAAMRCTVQG